LIGLGDLPMKAAWIMARHGIDRQCRKAMRFFFYGTLVAGSGNQVAASAQALLSDMGPATVPGQLHAVPDAEGWFPALLPGEGLVYGRLYAAGADFDAAELARLDAYEDFDPARPDSSLYVRTGIAATDAAGVTEEAQAYRFNQPLPVGSRPIAGGNFHAWLTEEGLPIFRGHRSAGE
jgi:gamma-glutamylcyclotransferase (GGCT)/AIG2-like uncharacterized protein YtfP